VFFVVVQLPLSRISPGWSFATCFLAWFIDHETKKWVFEVLRCILTLDIKGFRQLYAKELDFNQPDLPAAKDKDDTRASIDWACLNYVTMVSLLLNYFYRLFMERSVQAVANWMITMCD